MKKLSTLITGLMLCTSLGIAQDLPPKWSPPETFVKKSVVGLDPLGIMFDVFSGHYGLFRKNGQREYQLNLLHWQSDDETLLIGGGTGLRHYPLGSAKGPFFGGSLHFSMVQFNWYRVSGRDEWIRRIPESDYEAAEETSYLFSPSAEAGYRFTWENGLTLAPSFSVEYNLALEEDVDPLVLDQNEYFTGFGKQIDYNFGIELGYIF